MKKSIYPLFFAILTAVMANAQVDRSQAPTPGPAPEVALSDHSSFRLGNGLRVFVVENHKTPKVSFSLILDHDPILEGDKVGYVDMAGSLLRRGTQHRSKEELDEEIDFIGASLSTTATAVYASSLTKHMDKLLGLMTDVLLHPSFPPQELEKLKKQQLSALAQEKEDPEAISSHVRKVLFYGQNNPYGELTKEETVRNITIEDCQRYYKRYFRPNNAYLVIVGDINRKKAKKVVRHYFRSWEKDTIATTKYPFLAAPQETQLALVDRPSSVQSVINIGYPLVLRPNSKDLIKVALLNEVLGGSFSSRLMQNLREDKGYTYGVRSTISPDKLMGNFSVRTSVRNGVTDSAVHEILYEMQRIVENRISAEELAAAKAALTGSFIRSLESPATIAKFALNTVRYDLPDDHYRDYLKNIAAVTVEDIQIMAQEYIKPDNAHILIVGQRELIADKVKRFGTVSGYDTEGNSEDGIRPELHSEDGPTAGQVLNDYIEAIGGKAALSKISSIKLEYRGEVQGISYKIVKIQKEPHHYLEAIALGEQEIQKTIYNTGRAIVLAQGNELPLRPEQLREMKYKTSIFPEMDYKKWGYEMKNMGTGKIGRQEVYRIVLTSPTEDTETVYFAKDSGLKLKSENKRGTVSYADYETVNGIMIPHVLKIDSPVGKMRAVLKKIEFNDFIADSLFGLE